MMGRRTSLLALVAGALLASGCGGSVPWITAEPEGPAARQSLVTEPTFLILGASEGDVFEETDTETGKTEGSFRERRSGVTVRAGVFVVGAAESISFDPSFSVGASYELPLAKSLGLELGADYGGVSDAGGGRSSALVLISGGARIAPGGGGLYFAGCGVMLMESYVDDLTGNSGSNMAPLVNVSVGLRPPRGRWDARAGYTFPFDGNSPGIVTVTGGYAF